MRWNSRGSSRDAGNAQLVLLVAMLAALFLSVLVIRVGHADDMRTRAQSAADAAALAALQPLRQETVRMAMGAEVPDYAGFWRIDTLVSHTRAKEYAERNRGRMKKDPHITGAYGRTAKVEVRTRDCQLIPEDQLTEQQKRDLRDPRKLCTDNAGNKGIGRHANATAIAQFRPPTCEFIPKGYSGPITDGNAAIMDFICAGRWVADTTGRHAAWNEISPLFKVRLVAKEDPTPYTGGPPIFDFPGGGTAPPVPPGTPERTRKILEFIRAQVGKPYCWGGTGPSCFDCSGLLYTAYATVGLRIARVSFDQWNYPRIPNGSEAAGDFVFFNSGPNSGPNRPGHVGIVIDPKKKLMIEAACTACTPGVRVSSYQRGNLMGFTRPGGGNRT